MRNRLYLVMLGMIVLLPPAKAYEFSKEDIKNFQGLIISSGYVCNIVSKAQPMIMKNGFVVHCDNWNHSYDILDIGGRMTVKPWS